MSEFCDQCEYVCINGSYSHEEGCPNTPQKEKECQWCGESFKGIEIFLPLWRFLSLRGRV